MSSDLCEEAQEVYFPRGRHSAHRLSPGSRRAGARGARATRHEPQAPGEARRDLGALHHAARVGQRQRLDRPAQSDRGRPRAAAGAVGRRRPDARRLPGAAFPRPVGRGVRVALCHVRGRRQPHASASRGAGRPPRRGQNHARTRACRGTASSVFRTGSRDRAPLRPLARAVARALRTAGLPPLRIASPAGAAARERGVCRRRRRQHRGRAGDVRAAAAKLLDRLGAHHAGGAHGARHRPRRSAADGGLFEGHGRPAPHSSGARAALRARRPDRRHHCRASGADGGRNSALDFALRGNIVPTVITFDRDPATYQHWRLSFDGPVATLSLDVQEDAPIEPGYKLKLNSYDLGVDIELRDALDRIRFEHPEVGVVVVSSAKERMFCAGANIYMLGKSAHASKVNFCKFTNETRNGIEDSSEHSGLKFLAALNGTAAGGGYELALACDEIVLVDDRASTVSFPEVPLLGVLPGTGGLTRLVDKRRVRRDLADVFCTTAEGIGGAKAKAWGLVDTVVPPRMFAETVSQRARALAEQSDRPKDAKGVALIPLRRAIDDTGLH